MENLQQFCYLLMDDEFHLRPGDKLTFHQSRQVCMGICREVNYIGGFETLKSIKERLESGDFNVGGLSLTKGQMERVFLLCSELFNYEFKLFFPWSKSRKNTKLVIKIGKDCGAIR